MKLAKDQVSQGIAFLIHAFWMLLCLMLPISKALASTAMVALVILSVARLFLQKINLFKLIQDHPRLSILASLFFIYALSLIHSQDLAYGWKFTIRHSGLLAITGICLVNMDLIRRNIFLYLKIFIFAVAFNCFATLIFFILPEPNAISLAESLAFLKVKTYTVHSSRTAFGIYSPFVRRVQLSNLIAIATLFVLFLGGKRKLPIWSSILMFFLLLITSLILGGRAGILGLLAGLVVWTIWLYYRFIFNPLYKNGRATFAWSISLALIFTLAIAGPILAYKHLPKYSERFAQLKWEIEQYYGPNRENLDIAYSTTIRRIISWQYNWELVQEHPWFGVGIGDYEQELEYIYEKNNPGITENSHNQYLMVWAATGIFGLLFFLFSMGYWLKGQIQQTPFLLRILSLSILAAWATVFVFDATLNWQIDAMLFPMSLSFCWILRKE